MPNITYSGANVPAIDLTPFTGLPTHAFQYDNTGQKLVAQVTVSEDGDDELEITQFPVEQGAVINDHAFKRPAELRVQMGWSDAYINMASASAGGTSIQQVYSTILGMQAQRLTCTVFTAKRTYYNMLIQSIRVHNDSKLEFSFLVDIAFKEIVLVNTQAINVTGGIYSGSPPGYGQIIPTGARNGTLAHFPVQYMPDV